MHPAGATNHDRHHRPSGPPAGLDVEAGSLAYAARFATVLATAARQSLETAFAAVPASPAVQFLRELIDYLVSRTV